MGHPIGDTADQFHRATSTTKAALSTAKSLIHMGMPWVDRGHHRGLWTLERRQTRRPVNYRNDRIN